MITVVNKYKHTPTESDVYIGRGSVLGNPFTSRSGKTKAKFVCDSREEAIESFRSYLMDNIKKPEIRNELNRIYRMAKDGNVNLVCFCKPKACHGDVIKELIESKLA